mgnify:CR=1 FL=1
MSLLRVHRVPFRQTLGFPGLLSTAISCWLLLVCLVLLSGPVVGQQPVPPSPLSDGPFAESQQSAVPDWLRETQDRITAVEKQLAEAANAEEAARAEEKAKAVPEVKF